MPLLDPPPPENSNRSHAVQELLERHIPEQRPWTWMSPELLRHLEGAFEASRTHALMHMVKAGVITPEQAQEITPLQLFVAAFDLGITVGSELEKANDFRRLMGEEEI
jgi:hypothetical protein